MYFWNKRVFAAILGAVLLLMIVGCGKDDAKQVTSQVAGNVQEEQQGQQNQEQEQQEEEVVEEDALFPRTVVHMVGETTIEKKPERVALADVNIIDYFLILDEVPVGARIDTIDRSPTLKGLIDKYDPNGTITSIGGKVNMETLIGLDPDLIIIAEGKKENYERYSKITNTIVLDGSADRTVRLKQLGDIFGKEDKVEQLLTDLETLKAETKEKVKGKSEETVLFLRANGKDFTVLTPESHGLLYEEVGLKTAGQFTDLGQVTVEAISEADADHIFIMEARRQMDPDNIGALIEVWNDNSVWNNLNAVKNDQLYILDSLVTDDFFIGWTLELEALQQYLGE